MALRCWLWAMAMALLVHATNAEEEKRSEGEIATAGTLMGGVCFMMLLFYFTNSPDEDIRCYTYDVVSSTVSIFCAVLVFQGVNDLVESNFLEGADEVHKNAANFCLMLAWYLGTQATLGYFSGGICKKEKAEGEEEKEEAGAEETKELNLKCFATLMGHMTGFAAINFWGELMQLDYFSASPQAAILVVPVSLLGQALLHGSFNTLREWISAGGDGEVDEDEELWDEETEETENDVMGLALSFSIVQAMRFQISGTLPNEEGQEKFDVLQTRSIQEAKHLLIIGMVFMVLVLLVYGKSEGIKSAPLKRATEAALTTLSMSFAWSTYFSFKWLNASLHIAPEMMVLNVTLATEITFLSFLVIVVLDKIADREKAQGRDGVGTVRQVVKAIGILIGFAWEQCFDEALEAIAETSPYPHPVKLALSIFCAALFIPAWRKNILPMYIQEGYRWGFVIKHDEPEKWRNVIADEKFGKVMHSVHQEHKKLSSNLSAEHKALIDHVENKLEILKHAKTIELAMTGESSRDVSPRAVAATQASTAPQVVARKPLLPASTYIPPQLPGTQPARAGNSDMDALRKRNAQLETALKQMLQLYKNHMDVVDTTMRKVEDAMP